MDNAKVLYDAAESYFQRALDLYPGHADAIYNQATVTMDRTSSTDDVRPILNAMDTLREVIARDTSRRGETTGLAHRAIASCLVKHYDSVISSTGATYSIEDLINDAQGHMSTACEILGSDYPDLDELILEYSALVHCVWASYLQACTTLAPSIADATDMTNAMTHVHPEVLTKVLRMVKQLCATLTRALTTGQSSGVDKEVYLLWGEYLNDVIDGVIQGKQGVMCTALTQTDRGTLWQMVYNDLIQPLQSVNSSLLALFDDDQDALTLAGDLTHNYTEVLIVFRQLSTPEQVDTIPTKCLCALECRQRGLAACPTVSMQLALADEWVYVGKILRRLVSDSVLQSHVCTTLRGFVDAQRGAVSARSESMSHGVGAVVNVTDVDVSLGGRDGDASWEVLQCELFRNAKSIYVSAIRKLEECASSCGDALHMESVEGNDDDDTEDEDMSSVAYFNTACVCWLLNDEEGCKLHLINYITVEKKKRNDGVDVTAPPVGDVNAKILIDIASDDDLVGIKECSWFSEESLCS